MLADQMEKPAKQIMLAIQSSCTCVKLELPTCKLVIFDIALIVAFCFKLVMDGEKNVELFA